MRVGPTGPVTYLTDQSRKVTGQTCLDIYLGRLVGPWSLVLFVPGCRALRFFTGIVGSINVECARKRIMTATHTSALSRARIALEPRVDSTSEVAIYVVSGPAKQPN